MLLREVSLILLTARARGTPPAVWHLGKSAQWGRQDGRMSCPFCPAPGPTDLGERTSGAGLQIIPRNSLSLMPSVQMLLQNNYQKLKAFLSFPGGSAGKESARNAGDLGSIPGLGRAPGEGIGYPLQYSGLEKSTD